MNDTDDDYYDYESIDNELPNEWDESNEELDTEEFNSTSKNFSNDQLKTSEIYNCHTSEFFYTQDPNGVQYPKEVFIRTLMVLAIKLHRNLDNVVAKHMIQLIDAMCQAPPGFDSLYHFKRIVNNYSFPIQIHHFCPVCEMCIGAEIESEQNHHDQKQLDTTLEFQSANNIDNKILKCDNCEENTNLKNNRMAGNVFSIYH